VLAELLVNTEFHMAVGMGSVLPRPVNETGVAFMFLSYMMWMRDLLAISKFPVLHLLSAV